MPQGDGTGPAGQGSMTGRGMGYCAGNNVPGYAHPGFGRGMGRGRGFAFRARAFQQPAFQPAVITEKQEKEMLEADLSDLKAEMKEIEKRLKELKD
jgi:hypothetical protein